MDELTEVVNIQKAMLREFDDAFMAVADKLRELGEKKADKVVIDLTGDDLDDKGSSGRSSNYWYNGFTQPPTRYVGGYS